MPSLKYIAIHERFTMYVCVPFAEVDALKKALVKGGYKKISEEDFGDEHQIGVEVTCSNASDAFEIIESVISK